MGTRMKVTRKLVEVINKIRNFIQHGIFDENHIENEKYDLVFIAMIIEHVVDSNKFLESIYKVLKPGGIVICVWGKI